MVRALGSPARSVAWTATILGFFSLTAYGQQDPPSRVARLNYISGNVSMEPAGLDDWAPAPINHPFSIGDYLYTDQSARAELHLDMAVMRMGPQTSFGFLNLNDQGVQIKLAEGDMYFRMHDFSPDQTFEVDTPNAAVTLLANGIYRFRVDPNGNMSYTVVRQGQAQVTGGGQAFALNAGNSALLSGTDQMSFDVESAPTPDDFDNWCGQRDAHEAHLVSARYLPPTVIGYEDLDDYGGWQQSGQYGAVWYPHQVASDWAPYRSGHWVWVDPWGWTWVDEAPWGFAPFHYGRWAYISGHWGWCPGPMTIGYQGPRVRPYYAPALVAWFGGSHWGVSVSVGGGGPSLGWLALGFGEVYTPTYVCSRSYFTNVNVYNTRVVQQVNITNVYNTVYVNHQVYNREFVNVRAPGAVMAMPQTAFASGRPVAQAAIVVRQVNTVNIQAAVVVTPAVAPTRQALAASLGQPAARPAAQVMQRQVVVKSTPAPAPAPFAARQQYLQQHAGQLQNYQAMHQAVAPRATTVAYVRPAPAARTVAVHPGVKVGNPPPVAHGQIPAIGSTPARQNQPAQAQPAARAQQASQPAGRPGTTTQPGRVTAQQQPAATPAARGTPAARSTAAPTPAARTESRPAPAARSTAAPTPAARTELRPAPAARSTTAPTPAARTESRPAPAARSTAAPTPAARTESRPAPAARSTAAPTPAARTEPRPAARSTAPPARGESRPAPAPKERRTTEKDTKDTKEHQ